jgi:hypothetical protein
MMGTAGPDEGKNITTKAPALKHEANKNLTDERHLAESVYVEC